MKVNIEKLVLEARAHLEEKSFSKFLCRTDEIKALLKKGATPIDINRELIKKETYLHTVSYEGITFVNVTEKPVRKLGRYRVKNNPKTSF